MTSIRTNCPTCGEIEMAADVVFLAVEEGSGEGTYSFSCPGCERVVRKEADKNIVALLLSAGVRVDEVHQIRDVAPEQRPGGPAFTLDDVIDFHFLLERSDPLAELTGRSAR